MSKSLPFCGADDNCIHSYHHSPHYPNHLHSIFNKKNTTLDGLENFYRKLVHIPCGWWLSKNDLKKIVDIVVSKT